MSTSQKEPDGKAKKPSFWEKLSERSASSDSGSLVNAIVRQAEKEAAGDAEKNQREDADEKKKALAWFANSRTFFIITIILVAGTWFYFWTMLSDSNPLYSKFGQDNVTTEFNRKTTLLQQAETDFRDLQKFNKLLRIEDLSSKILTLDLENPILNYERPTGERVVPQEGSTNVLLKTTNSSGEVVYLSEIEVLSLERSKSARTEAARKALEEIVTQANNLGTFNTGAKIEDLLSVLVSEITAIDPNESNFPSAILKSHFAAAQSAANSILKNVKSVNLENLVADIKKQVNLIDESGLDQTSTETIEGVKAILAKLSPKQASSFEKALSEIQALDITKITNADVYETLIKIVGDPRNTDSSSDLATAMVITNNMGRVNTIGELRANRIAWSTVIERVEKVIRLGSDLTRDTDGTPADATRDIDPNNTLVSINNYSGKSSKGVISVSGNAYGKELYQARNFTLVADLIDALEGSKYFKDVDGFSFSREEDRQGDTSSPINFEFSLQDPAIVDERDITISLPKTEKAQTTQELPAANSTNTMTQEELQNLEFNFQTPKTEELPTSNPESVEVFEALDTTLNN